MLKRTASAAISILLIFTVVAYAQMKMPLKTFTGSDASCKDCHTCDNPTTQKPCQRTFAGHWTGKELGPKLIAKQVPDTLFIGELENKYDPAKFPHKQHLHMVKSTEFCIQCHHYAPPGQQPCKSCHPKDYETGNVSSITLESAYHRKCINCHLEWGKDTNCEACHTSKDKTSGEDLAAAVPKYRERKAPDKTVYLTRYFSGPVVEFPHKKHTDNKKLVCTDCHSSSACIACHYQEVKPTTVSSESRQGVHGTCSYCHETVGKDSCVKCHKTTEEFNKLTSKK